MSVRSRVAVVLVGVVGAVDGAVAQLRERDAAAVHAAQLAHGARRRVRAGPARRLLPRQGHRWEHVILVHVCTVTLRGVCWFLHRCCFLKSKSVLFKVRTTNTGTGEEDSRGFF